MTTVASISSSNQSKTTIRSNRSYWSRRSSRWRSGILSVTASPLVSRRTSQQSRLRESVASPDRQALLNVALLSFNGRGTGEDAGKKLGDMTYHVSALEKNAKRKPRSASSPQEPFVISSGIPFNFPMLPIGRKVFKNPWSLPHFKALRHQRSLLRLLLLKSCVTGLCWLPLYVAFALQLSSVKYPQELHQFQTAKSDDEIEGARLLHVRPLLWQIFWGHTFKENLYITDWSSYFWEGVGWLIITKVNSVQGTDWANISCAESREKPKYIQKLKIWFISAEKIVYVLFCFEL